MPAVLQPRLDLHVPELRDFAEAVLEGGAERGVAIRAVAALADELVDWAAILPAPVGIVIEVLDRPVAHALARAVVRAVERARG